MFICMFTDLVHSFDCFLVSLFIHSLASSFIRLISYYSCVCLFICLNFFTWYWIGHITKRFIPVLRKRLISFCELSQGIVWLQRYHKWSLTPPNICIATITSGIWIWDLKLPIHVSLKIIKATVVPQKTGRGKLSKRFSRMTLDDWPVSQTLTRHWWSRYLCDK